MPQDADPEIKAMSDAYKALNELEGTEAKERVLNWLISKFSIDGLKLNRKNHDNNGGENIELSEFETVADMFSKANVKVEAEKILVVASFLQLKFEKKELTSREINQELRHLGHGIGSITHVIDSLIDRKPKLMIKLRKEGKSKQAQKKFKVTDEGLKAASKLLHSHEND